MMRGGGGGGGWKRLVEVDGKVGGVKEDGIVERGGAVWNLQ